MVAARLEQIVARQDADYLAGIGIDDRNAADSGLDHHVGDLADRRVAIRQRLRGIGQLVGERRVGLTALTLPAQSIRTRYQPEQTIILPDHGVRTVRRMISEENDHVADRHVAG